MRAAVVPMLLLAVGLVDARWSFGPDSFNCAMRKFAYQYGMKLLPKYGSFENLFVALNLNNECKDGDGRPDFTDLDKEPAPPVYPSAGTTYFVDFRSGSDSNDGSIQAPFKTIQHAIDQPRGPVATVNLRAGTHYLSETVKFNASHSGLVIQNYNGEAVTVSGGASLKPSWQPYKVDSKNNMYVTSVAGSGITDFPGFQMNGVRVGRARFPNGNLEYPQKGLEAGCDDGPVLISGQDASWTPPDASLQGTQKYVTNPNPAQMRNTTSIFMSYTVGIGGPCKIFDPPVSYWCSEKHEAGSAFEVPRGVTPHSNAVAPPNGDRDSGLHMPYKHMDNAIVNTWHPDRWANWMFEVQHYDNKTNNVTFGKGGFQGARGAGNGDQWFVENVFEEFDFPNEYFHDPVGQKLYFFYNGTGAPSQDAEYVVPQLKTLFNLTASRWDPIRNVAIRGLKMTQASYTYMDPHGVPSAGDWALDRMGAVFLQGTEQVTIEGCHLTRLDGNGVFVSGYNRNATISDNEFSWLGGNAMAGWGFTNETAANPLEGFDGTDGNHPQFTKVLRNLGREIGIHEKQSSFWFQGKVTQTLVQGNVFFNGPRAGINFNDGFGGGDIVENNLVFSTCRESGDHGPINSWDRQPYLTLTATGKPNVLQQWREIRNNFLITNYNVLAAIDNDDGSAYYHAYDNFIVSGTMGLKSHVGGHHNWHYRNVYGYLQRGFWNGDADLPDLNLAFFNNSLIMTGNEIGHNEICSGPGKTIVHDLTVYNPDANVTECGHNPPQSPGTTVHKYPTDDFIINLARPKLGM